METCKYCLKKFKGLGTHMARCKAKKRWQEQLDNEGIIEENNQVTFSGGMTHLKLPALKDRVSLRGHGD